MVSDDEIIEFIANSEYPALGTGEIAEQFDMSTQGISKRLRDLADRGEIQTRMIGPTRVWWI